MNYVGANGIRAIACMMVVGHHLFQKLDVKNLNPIMKILSRFFLEGSVGVSIFFVLSGFLLSAPFFQNYFENKDMPSLKNYITKRGARIIPAYYLNMYICFFLSLFLIDRVPSLIIRYWTGILFLSPFHWLTFFPSEFNGPLWSIGFEVFSYILMPLGMVFLFRIKGQRNLVKSMIYWFFVLILIVIFSKIWIHYGKPSDFGKGWQYGLIGGAKDWMPKYNPFSLFQHFVIGIFTALIVVFLKKSKYSRSYLAFDILGFLSIVSFIMFLLVDWTKINLFFIKELYYFPLFPLFIMSSLIFLNQSKYLGRFLDKGIFKITAELSFGIYIWHAIVIDLVHMFWKKEFSYGQMSNLTEWSYVSFIVILASYLIAYISWKKFEKPILDYYKNKEESKKLKFSTKISLFIFLFIIPGLVAYYFKPSVFLLDKLYF